MKKYFYYSLLSMMVLFFSISFSSCSKNSDDEVQDIETESPSTPSSGTSSSSSSDLKLLGNTRGLFISRTFSKTLGEKVSTQYVTLYIYSKGRTIYCSQDSNGNALKQATVNQGQTWWKVNVSGYKYHTETSGTSNISMRYYFNIPK